MNDLESTCSQSEVGQRSMDERGTIQEHPKDIQRPKTKHWGRTNVWQQAIISN